MPWSAKFNEPIPLPGRKPLVSLRDAANHIMRLPKAERELPHWQAACEALILVAEEDGPVMLARIGMLRAINHGRAPEKRQRKAKVYRIIRSS
jgi:hypothetical protein